MEIICNEWMTYIDRIVIYDNHINVVGLQTGG